MIEDSALSASVLLSWREGTTAALAGEGKLIVAAAAGRVVLRGVAPVLLDALSRLDPPGEDEELLVRRVESKGNGTLAKWYYYLENLSRRGLICQYAEADGIRLATLAPISSSFALNSVKAVADRRYVLSRFAFLRREGNHAVLESSLAHARIILNDCRTAAIVSSLSTACALNQVASQTAGLSATAIAAVMTLLLRAGMLGEADHEGNCTEDMDPSLQTWAFHDLLLHSRSRPGRFDAPHGGTFRFVGELEPPPAVRPPYAGATRELHRPDLAKLERDDPPLAWTQEHRRSIRAYDKVRPITDKQLGEFLYRVARVKELRKDVVLRAPEHALSATPDDSVSLDFTSRPYPAGGSLYELEFYLAVRSCLNLEGGLYHYNPLPHSMTQVCEQTPDVDRLFRDAAQSAAIPEEDLQVLLILAARVPRLAWKYESIAYALTLKHVGVMFQNMYLTATAMNLAPCAIGAGDADLFARVTGNAYWAETSVGEFLLGSRPTGHPVPA